MCEDHLTADVCYLRYQLSAVVLLVAKITVVVI